MGLAKTRGATREQRRLWRDGIYDQIREVMPMQGGLSIERMCELAKVTRAGFYRSLQEQAPSGRKHGSAVRDSANRAGTSTSLWPSSGDGGVETPQDVGESQTSDKIIDRASEATRIFLTSHCFHGIAVVSHLYRPLGLTQMRSASKRKHRSSCSPNTTCAPMGAKRY